MKKYSSYKCTRLPWIDRVPSHWFQRRYKDLLSEENHKVGDEPITLLSLSKNGGVIVRDLSENKGKFSKDFVLYKIVRPGNLVMCLFDVDETPRTVGLSRIYGMITGAYNIFSIKNININFLELHFLEIDNRKAFRSMYKGLRKTIPTNTLLSSYIFIPPIEEQDAIVKFISEKSEKIDLYITEQERLLELLDELRQAEISQAVTNGLNPNSSFLDSGIGWISKIPSHWKIKRAKNIFNKISRPVRPEDEIITCFRDGQVTLRKNRRTEGFTESLQENGYQGIRKGDLVIHQMDAFAGSIGVSDSDGKGTPVYICCVPKIEVNVYYFAFLMREMARTGYIKSLYRGIRERSSDFRYDTFAVQKLPIPPLNEQNLIVAYLDEKTAKIDRMKTSVEKKISLLKEFKQRLISDAVTGKIDVRE